MKKISTTLCSLLMAIASFSQAILLTKDAAEDTSRNIISDARYIFEATAVKNSSHSYFNTDSTETYGSFLLEVLRVYRGNLSLGTVEVIFAGANIFYEKDGQKYSRVVSHGESPNVQYGIKYIFFADDTRHPSDPSNSGFLSARNSQKISLRYGNWSWIQWPTEEKFIGPAGMSKFTTEKEVYDYLRSFDNVHIPDSVYQSAFTINPFIEKRKAEEKYMQEKNEERYTRDKPSTEEKILAKINKYKSALKIYELKRQYQGINEPQKVEEAQEKLKYWENRYERFKKKGITEDEIEQELIQDEDNGQTVTLTEADALAIQQSTHEITFNVTNQRFTENQSYYEFDVFAKVNQSTVYLDWAFLALDYNTNLFGSSIAPGIVITNGPLYDPQYYEGAVFDDDNDTFLLSFFATSTIERPNKVARLMGNDTYELLCHVKIPITNNGCNIDTNLDYNLSVMNNSLLSSSYGLSPSIPSTIDFDHTYVTDFTSIRTCIVVITGLSYNALPIIAGKNSQVTIYGSNFGTTRGTGQVSFKNADDGGNTYLSGLDPIDYISWSENSITVKVPSRVVTSIMPGQVIPSAGSGRIKVTNSQGYSAESNEEVTIDYSLENFADPDFKVPYYLRNQDGSGGITFRLGNGISGNAEARAAIEKALNEWSCNLNIDLKLGADISAGAAHDSQNVIYINGAMTPGMRTDVSILTCGSRIGAVDLESSTYVDIDIAINSGVFWHYESDFSSVPNGKYDFYAAFLHELGHALGLRHVNHNSSDLMYWSQSNSGISFSNRKNVRNSHSARTGAIDVATTSKQLNWGCTMGSGKTLSNSVIPRNCEGLITGINDWIEVSGTTLFNPGNSVSYSAEFVSADGTTYPTQWNWSLKLYHGEGAYEYASRSVNSTSMADWWYLTPSSNLPDYAWVRTPDNWIYGEVIVNTVDNDGYINVNTLKIQLRFKPNTPEIVQYRVENGIAHFTYNAAGASSYNVHYDLDANVPYAGTGAAEGNSPINTGASTAHSLTGLDFINKRYFVAITASNAAGTTSYSNPISFSGAVPVVWTDLVNVTAEGNTITKSGTSYLWNADAASLNILPQSANGWVEMEVKNTDWDIMLGLSWVGIHGDYSDINYACHLSRRLGNKTVKIYNNGLPVPEFYETVTYVPGDIFRVERADNHIYYKKNGVTFYVFPGTDAPLKADVSLFDPGSQIFDARYSHGVSLQVTGYPISWTDLVNTSANGNTLSKASSSYLWNAGAASTNIIPAFSDGAIEMTINSTNWDIMFGLSNVNTDATWNSIQYNCYISRRRSHTARIYAYSTLKHYSPINFFAVGDQFKVERIGSTMYFKKNDLTFYSMPCDNSQSLRADVSMFDPTSQIFNAYCTHPAQVASSLSRFKDGTFQNLTIGTYEIDTVSFRPEVNRIVVSPNPTSGKVIITYNEENKVFMRLISPSGVLLQNRFWYPAPTNRELVLDLEQYPAGLYMLHLNNDVIKLIRN